MKVAIQGLIGSFHHEAAEKMLSGTGEPIRLLECNTFVQVFDAVEKGEAAFGVAAVENNLFGSINPVYGLLERYPLHVAGDTTLHINQYLIAGTATSLELLQEGEAEVRSQVMAIAQCDLWLSAHLPRAVRREMNDTTESVQWAVREKDPRKVAIAGERAAQMHGGHIVAGPINDDPNNFTRFFLLKKDGIEQEGAVRTSIIMRTSNAPGALYHALGAFQAEDIDLSKLDSHPVPGDKRHYSFYVDFEAPLSSPQAQRALAALKEQSCVVRVLGSYPVTA